MNDDVRHLGTIEGWDPWRIRARLSSNLRPPGRWRTCRIRRLRLPGRTVAGPPEVAEALHDIRDAHRRGPAQHLSPAAVGGSGWRGCLTTPSRSHPAVVAPASTGSPPCSRHGDAVSGWPCRWSSPPLVLAGELADDHPHAVDVARRGGRLDPVRRRRLRHGPRPTTATSGHEADLPTAATRRPAWRILALVLTSTSGS